MQSAFLLVVISRGTDFSSVNSGAVIEVIANSDLNNNCVFRVFGTIFPALFLHITKSVWSVFSVSSKGVSLWCVVEKSFTNSSLKLYSISSKDFEVISSLQTVSSLVSIWTVVFSGGSNIGSGSKKVPAGTISGPLVSIDTSNCFLISFWVKESLQFTNNIPESLGKVNPSFLKKVFLFGSKSSERWFADSEHIPPEQIFPSSQVPHVPAHPSNPHSFTLPLSEQSVSPIVHLNPNWGPLSSASSSLVDSSFSVSASPVSSPSELNTLISSSTGSIVSWKGLLKSFILSKETSNNSYLQSASLCVSIKSSNPFLSATLNSGSRNWILNGSIISHLSLLQYSPVGHCDDALHSKQLSRVSSFSSSNSPQVRIPNPSHIFLPTSSHSTPLNFWFWQVVIVSSSKHSLLHPSPSSILPSSHSSLSSSSKLPQVCLHCFPSPISTQLAPNTQSVSTKQIWVCLQGSQISPPQSISFSSWFKNPSSQLIPLKKWNSPSSTIANSSWSEVHVISYSFGPTSNSVNMRACFNSSTWVDNFSPSISTTHCASLLVVNSIFASSVKILSRVLSFIAKVASKVISTPTVFAVEVVSWALLIQSILKS